MPANDIILFFAGAIFAIIGCNNGKSRGYYKCDSCHDSGWLIGDRDCFCIAGSNNSLLKQEIARKRNAL